jgi:peptidoglycan/LPS O-acetylase OafA/YrhL
MINADAFTHSKNDSTAILTPERAVSFSVSEIDVVLVVMPFTLAAASSTWTWVSLQHQEFFKSDPEWGPELFSDPRMLLYELLYCFEVFALLCALLSLSADPAPVEYTFVTALLLTFLVLFFCAQSHQQRVADQAEHTISMIVFSILSSLVSFFVVQHWSGGCPTKRSSGLLLVVVVLTLAIFHMSTREDTTAGTVILL